MSIPDSTLAAIREHDQRLQEGEAAWAEFEPHAREELLDALMSPKFDIKGPNVDVSLDLLFDDFVDALGDDYQAFRSAIADGKDRSNEALGALVRKALERAAQRYLACDAGERWIANRVYQLYNDSRSEYSE